MRQLKDLCFPCHVVRAIAASRLFQIRYAQVISGLVNCFIIPFTLLLKLRQRKMNKAVRSIKDSRQKNSTDSENAKTERQTNFLYS